MAIEFLPVDEKVKTSFEHLMNGTAFKTTTADNVRGMCDHMEGVVTLLRAFGLNTDATALNAMTMTTMDPFREYVHEKTQKAGDELALVNAWTSDFLGFGQDKNDEEST